jgi:hypothetical protein
VFEALRSAFCTQVVHEPPEATYGGVQLTPHIPETQVAVPLAGTGHGVHEVPQLSTLVFDTQTAPQRCVPDGQELRQRPVVVSQPSAQLRSLEEYWQEPEEATQVPVEAKVRCVVASTQLGAGGVLQLRAAPTHAPVAAHESLSVHAAPSSQEAPMSGWYVQAPATQTPGRKQGRAAHVTPAHGSPVH